MSLGRLFIKCSDRQLARPFKVSGLQTPFLIQFALQWLTIPAHLKRLTGAETSGTGPTARTEMKMLHLCLECFPLTAGF